MATPTFTYTADPTNSPLDAVRLTLGDTNAKDPLLYDGEVAYFLSQAHNNVAQACYQACGAIVAKLSRLCDETVGQVSLSLSQRLKGYSDLQMVLQRDLGTGANFFCGGISRQQVRQSRCSPDAMPTQVPENQTDPPRRSFACRLWGPSYW